MKKLMLLAIATFVTGVALANAGDRKIGAPRNQDGTVVETADYSGVDLGVSTGGVLNSRVIFSGEGVLNSVIFSSGTCGDYVIVYDSGSIVGQNASLERARIYNTITSSETVAGISVWCSGERALAYPLRLRKGLTVTPSNGVYNVIGYGYNKFGKD